MASYADYQGLTSQDFESYTSQSYDQILATDGNFGASSSYLDGSFTGFETTTMPPFASNLDFVGSTFDASTIKQPGSPAGSLHSAMASCPPNLSSSSDSSASVPSSTIGSPSSHQPQSYDAWSSLTNFCQDQTSMTDDSFVSKPFSTGFEYEELITEKLPGFVDPHLIQQSIPSFNMPSPCPEIRTPRFPYQDQPPSPALSSASLLSTTRTEPRRFKVSGSQSPYFNPASFHPYASQAGSRRMSQSSIHSKLSASSRRSASFEFNEDNKEKGLCPHPDCGRVFKDLKAHLFTHASERPEKCPIMTCEYHVKGFARKYDKNRHTLTHYKGTMVCGFCPGSGSSAEKSFNRADVFKRHLTSVHGVEQAPPNSRKKNPATVSPKKSSTTTSSTSTSGTCSTCSVTFANAQEFYEHLDDCVLRVVQQADPSEEINQRLLTSVADDKEVKDTLDLHSLPNDIDNTVTTYDDDDDDDDYDNDNYDDENVSKNPRSGKGNMRSGRKAAGRGAIPSHVVGNSRVTKASSTRGGNQLAKAGLTFSKRGVKLSGSGRKKRKNYPVSWGSSIDKMKMKKRVLCVYDGQRRLWKDDMMLDQEFEVRKPCYGGYVTDLDVQTLRRAEAFHESNEEERGPWTPDNFRMIENIESIAQ